MSPESAESIDQNVAKKSSGENSSHGLCTDALIERLEKLWSTHSLSSDDLIAPAGHRVGRYVIDHVVGLGAFGIVYCATDEKLGRSVALKLPRPEVLVDDKRLKRFEDEAAAAAALDHPAIVPILEANLDSPIPYIASAFCFGPDLGKWLDKQPRPVDPVHAAEFVEQLADAVHHAHEHGVLHRDLKPSNVMLEPKRLVDDACKATLADFKPRLTDFGLAKLIETAMQETRSSVVVGTPVYMAPEQLAASVNRNSPATDVFGLGVLLFELLTLQTPYTGSSYVEVLDKIRNQAPSRLREINADQPVELATICEKCLAREQDDRYATAMDLREDLRKFLDGDAILAKPFSWWGGFQRWMRKPQRVIQAGRATIWIQTLMCVWSFTAFSAGLLIDAFPEVAVLSTATDLAVIAVAGNAPLALLGCLISRGALWPFWPATIASVVFLIFTMLTATQEPTIFAELYPTPHTKVNTFAGLVLATILQAVFFVIAIPAWMRQRRHSRQMPA